MTQLELLKFIQSCEARRVFFYPRSILRQQFAKESEDTFERSMSRHVSNGVLERAARGIYASVRARELDAPLSAFANIFRPMDLFYLSLESALTDVSVISQTPGVNSIVTNGAPENLNTPYGRIEFVHSKKRLCEGEFFFDEYRQMLVASPARAYDDMVRLNRSTLDLVDLDELKIAQADFERDHPILPETISPPSP